VRLSSREQERLWFQFNLQHTRATLTELSQLRFEQLGKNGETTSTLIIPPHSDYPKDAFEHGWTGGQNMIQLSIPASDLDAGKWRLTVEGKMGKEEWRSERIEVEVP